MITKKLFFAMAAAMALGACSSDDDEENNGNDGNNGNNPPQETNTLETYLDGEFRPDSVTFEGNAVFGGSPMALNGSDDEPTGSFNFDAEAELVSYDIEFTTMLTLGGSPVPFPVELEGNGVEFRVISQTRFRVNDPTYGTLTFSVVNRSESNIVSRTNLNSSSGNPELDLDVTMFLEKQ